MGNSKSKSKKKSSKKNTKNDKKSEATNNASANSAKDNKKAPRPSIVAQRKVCLDDFVLLTTVGKGSFGKVIQVRKKDSGQIYAMKVLKKAQVIRRKQYEHTMTERHILEEVRAFFFYWKRVFVFLVVVRVVIVFFCDGTFTPEEGTLLQDVSIFFLVFCLTVVISVLTTFCSFFPFFSVFTFSFYTYFLK